MTVKANLRIVLWADEVTVAETVDPDLWQHILAKINGSMGRSANPGVQSSSHIKDVASNSQNFQFGDHEDDENLRRAIEVFAGDMKLDPITVRGACDPTTEPPYIHLDVHAWQEFRRNVPPRGNISIPPVVLASTLLVLWYRAARLGTVSISQAQAVLNTIETRDKNPARGLKNCAWLQTRDDAIKVNPTRYDQANAVARAYCSHQPIEER